MKGAREESRFRHMARARTVALCLFFIVLGVPVLSALAGGGYSTSPATASSYPGDPFRLPRMLEEEDIEEEPEEEPRVIRRYSTEHVPARVIQDLVGTLGIDVQTVIFPTNAYVMWVRGTEDAHARLRDVMMTADVRGNQMSLDYQMLTLQYITPDRAVDLLEEIGIDLERYFYYGLTLVVFDEEILNRWEEVAELVRSFDGPPSHREVVFTYSLEHLSVDDAGGILGSMDLEGVTTRPFDYPDSDIAHEMIVICPPHLEDHVRAVLADIDSRRSSVRMPLDSARGEGAREELMGKRGLLARLSGLSERSMRISENLMGDDDDPWYVLWVEETPDNIQLLQSLLDEFN